MSSKDHKIIPDMKRCSKGDDCVHPDGCWQPATSEYFSKRKSSKDGLRGQCKKCRSEYHKEYRQEHRERLREYHEQWHQENPEYHKQYYQENREQKLENSRRWHQENKEQQREYHKQYYQDNREQQRENMKQWRQDNPEYAKQHYQENRKRYQKNKKQWRQDNPELNRLYEQRRRARKRGLPDTLTPTHIDMMMDYFDYSCAVCGRPFDMFTKPELDHWIPLASDDCTGTIPTNTVPLCGNKHGFVSYTACNPSKSDTDALEWLVRQFGDKEAEIIYNRIMDYFEWIEGQDCE